MNGPTPPSPARAAPNRLRDRLRLGALLALVALWVLPPWVEAQVGDRFVPEVGAVRSGVAAALGLLALWGLSATSLASRTLRGLRVGAALTDAILAATVTGLLMTRHPWIPGGEIREAWVPIFGPLALLGVLEAVVLGLRRDAGHEIAIIRAGAALFAAAAFAVDQAWIPVGIAVWLGLSPLMFVKLRRPVAARRSLEVFVLAAAAVAGLAPWIQRDLVGVHPAVGSEYSLWLYLWCVTAAVVVTIAADGIARPEGGADAPPAR